jgi:putative ABC transport system substrate-binding protein
MKCGLIVLTVSIVFSVPTARALDAVVVKSSDIRLYDAAISGFQDEFKGTLTVLTMKSKATRDTTALIDQIRNKQPQVIVTVGLSATRTMTAVFTRIPIVFCMAVHHKKHKLKTGNSTGVEIGPRPREQLAAFTRVIPGLQRVGLIYNPKVTGHFVGQVEQAARELDLTLVARKVNQRSQVLDALKVVANSSDAIWLIRDQTVMSREFFNYALILQADKKIPLLAFSPVFVEKGAVACFAAQYRDQGRQAAELATAILNGTDPADLPVQAPRGTLYINTRAAGVANVKIPKRLLSQPGVKVTN